MKKIVGLTILVALCSPLYAAGPYDGIYSVSSNGFFLSYVSMHEENNRIIAIVVDPNPNNTWQPVIGTRVGNTVSLTNMHGVGPSDISIDVTMNLNSSGASTATIESCDDGVDYVCIFPAGTTVDMDKIF